jgi:hypothetical protein
MSVTVNVNGVAISYPQTGDSEWGDEATDFAIQTGSALGKIGLSTGTSVNITSTLGVTGATTLDSTLTVAGTATLNGNTNLGNAITDTVTVTAILNVDSGTLYVNPATNKVGINDSTPSEALDVTGNVAVSGSITGASATLTDLTVDTNVIKTDSTNNRVGINTTSPTVALDVTGNIKASSQIQIPDGTVSIPGISPSSETGSGLYKIATNKLGIAINGVRVGEVGVGYGGFTGNIIQVLQTSIDTQLSTSSTSYVDITGLSVSITPKYSTSKILIRFKLNGSNTATSNLNAYQIVRGSTAVGNGAVGSRRFCHSAVRGSIGDANSSFVASGEFLDSPSTTSATTYKMQFLVDSGTGYINRDAGNVDNSSYPSPLSSITVMEVQQ